MGNKFGLYNKLYNVPINNEDRKNNETSIYRHPQNLKLKPFNQFKNLQKLLLDNFSNRSPEDILFLERVKNDKNEFTKETKGISYGTFKTDIDNFGRGILELDLLSWKEEFRNFKLRFLGIYAANSYKYFVQDASCILYNFVSVPIYDTLGEEATLFAFSNTNMETLCLDLKHLKKMLELKISGNLPNLKNMILINDDQVENLNELKDNANKASINLYTWTDIINKGKQSKINDYTNIDENDIYCFSYTSGTTGTPKGAMISHKNFTVNIEASITELKVTDKDRHLNYLPMAHMMERSVFLVLFKMGCQVGLSCGDVSKLKEDLEIFKPTIFVSVPRLYNKFYDAIKAGFESKKNTFQGKLANYALKVKLQNFEKTGTIEHVLYDNLIFNKVKNILGGRVRLMVTGSAPLNVEVANFLKIVMCCPMAEAYGQTEATGGEFAMNITDTNSGHVEEYYLNLSLN